MESEKHPLPTQARLRGMATTLTSRGCTFRSSFVVVCTGIARVQVRSTFIVMMAIAIAVLASARWSYLCYSALLFEEKTTIKFEIKEKYLLWCPT